MVSDIKGPGGPAAHSVNAGLRKVDQQGAAGSAAAGERSEVVTVTDLAARLQKLSDSVADLPVVDQALVNEMREALANGDYQVDERQIADKLASFENLLGRLDRK